MDNELRELRVNRSIPAKDMVEVVKAIYPRFDKPLLSKCEHGDEYGIDLRRDAMSALYKEYGVTPVATPQDEQKEAAAIPTPKPDNRRLKCRISCRLEDAEYDALLRYIKADGFDTMQAWLSMTVRRYIKRRAAKEAEE